MLIKESARLKKGEIVKLKIYNTLTLENEEKSVIVDIVSPHNVTFKTKEGRNINRCNVDLVREGIYKRTDALGNIMPTSTEEAVEMMGIIKFLTNKE